MHASGMSPLEDFQETQRMVTRISRPVAKNAVAGQIRTRPAIEPPPLPYLDMLAPNLYFVLRCIEIWGHLSCLYHLDRCVGCLSMTRECHRGRRLGRACRVNVAQATVLTPLSRQMFDEPSSAGEPSSAYGLGCLSMLAPRTDIRRRDVWTCSGRTARRHSPGS